MKKLYQNSNNPVFEVQGDVDPLLKRLRSGMVVQARIVLCLQEEKYLLRIYGYNLIMKSSKHFERFDEILLRVLKTRPILKLEIVSNKTSGNKPDADKNTTDIIVF